MTQADDLAVRFDAAQALHRDGLLTEAEAGYQAILAVDPAHFDAHLHLGTAALQAGRVEQAVTSIQTAVALDPNSAVARSHLATAFQLLGRTEEAIAAYEDALVRDSELAEAHFGIANALHLSGRFEEAMTCYQRAVAIDPDYAEAYLGLAETYQKLKLHAKAIPVFEAALAIDPDYAEALCGLGRAFQWLSRFDEALTTYRRAIAADPTYAEAHNSLGTALQALDRHDEALQHFEAALALQPDYTDAHCRMGLALQEIGRIEEAEHAFEAAIEREPDKPQHYYLLTNVRRMTAGDRHLEAMQRLAANEASHDVDGRIHLHFALAKGLADCGDHSASFRHLTAGNALKRREIVYDEIPSLRALERLATLCSAAFLDKHAHGGGDPTPAPIFLVGMPRSGSTLIEQILAGHSRAAACGERADLRDSLLSVVSDTGMFPEFIPSMTDAQFREIGSSYRARMERAAGQVKTTADRYTDKTLNNFCLIGIIRRALPNAKILHCRREPIDTCMSCFSQLFGSDLPYTYDLAELGRYYRQYAALMGHWRATLPEDVMLDVSYENLVNDFDTEVRRILEFCGLDFEPACLAFHETKRPVRTASATQVREPLNRRSIGRVRPDADLLSQLESALKR